MRVVKTKISNHFLSRILRDEIDLSGSELPRDVEVAGTKATLSEEWFWVYLKSKEFMDVDPDFGDIPELTLWFGSRRK